jgi:hypothetical protein
MRKRHQISGSSIGKSAWTGKIEYSRTINATRRNVRSRSAKYAVIFDTCANCTRELKWL